MFILDSLLISGIQWALKTTLAAAEAEMNDDTALREQLLDAEMRREMGEISDEEFAGIEGDLLARIREIRDRREGTDAGEDGAALEASPDSRFQVEAEVAGTFHDTGETGATHVVREAPERRDHVVVTPPPAAAPAIAARRRPRRPRATRRTRSGR
jgi:hypothetical protein